MKMASISFSVVLLLCCGIGIGISNTPAAVAQEITIVHSFPFPSGWSYARDIAWDGEYLWSGCIAGWSSRVNQVDPRTGQVHRFHFTKGVPDAVESNGQFLWTASHNGDILFLAGHISQLEPSFPVADRLAPTQFVDLILGWDGLDGSHGRNVLGVDARAIAVL